MKLLVEGRTKALTCNNPTLVEGGHDAITSQLVQMFVEFEEQILISIGEEDLYWGENGAHASRFFLSRSIVNHCKL